MVKSRQRERAIGAVELGAVLDPVPAAIALLDCAGQIVFVNRFWRDGVRGNGFIGGNVGLGADYVETCREMRAAEPGIAQRLGRGLADILAGRRRRLEIEYSSASRTRPRRFRCIAATAGGTARARAVVLHFEIARRAASAPESSALGAFASGIAHDLGNLLLGMAGLLDAVAAELAAESAAARRLAAVRDGIEQAGAMSRQVLAFARGEEKRQTRVDLACAIGRALDLLGAALPPNVALERNLEPVGEAAADPVRLRQLMLNLGANAVDAIGGGRGWIRVTLERIGTRDLPAGLRRISHARLRFADDGAGMRPEIVERIFEPFFTTKREGRGTGLGLAVVQGIVADHGGRIEVRSAPGEGTELTIWLPLARPARGVLNRADFRPK